MPSKRWFLSLALSVTAAPQAPAEIFKGVMGVKGAEMS
jgi:hypothetical protein